MNQYVQTEFYILLYRLSRFSLSLFVKLIVGRFTNGDRGLKPIVILTHNVMQLTHKFHTQEQKLGKEGKKLQPHYHL